MSRQSDKIVVKQRHRFKNGMLIIGLCFIVAMAYPVLDRELSDLYAVMNAGLIGLLGGIGMALHQDFSLYNRMRRYHFLKRLGLVAVIYTLGLAIIIILVTGFTGSLENNESFISHIRSPFFQDFLLKGEYRVILLYAVVLSSILSFVFIMHRKVDGRVLWNIVSGKYAIPKYEDRIFMFLDLNDSTKIAEELGEIPFFEFMNEFFADITPAILKTGGSIYRYVGDEIVVTWAMKKNLNPARSIKTYFLARNALRRQKEKYLSRFNIVPGFKAVFHCGTVIVGEIGDVKTQIVFNGNMMYIGGLMEKQCKKLGRPILVSSSLMEKTLLPKLYKVEYCGELNDPSQTNIELYTITERNNFKLI